MPPFSSMLRTKKGRKSRPRTPPSPGSFYSPPVAGSPAPWRERANSEARAGGVPPSSWTDKSLPRRPPRSVSDDESTRHASPLRESLVPDKTPEMRRVPSPIKIPRSHVHAPNVTIQQSPPPPPRPASNCPSSESSSPSEAPELLTFLRAERASASMLGLGFSLRAESVRLSAFGSVRVESATLPVDMEEQQGQSQSASTDESPLYPPVAVARAETASPARPATVYAIHRISEVPSPAVDPSTSFLPLARPSSDAQSTSPPSFLPTCEPSSPVRQRSQTVTGERQSGRDIYQDAGRQRSASATSPNIKRSRSPSAATSGPATPPDTHPLPTRTKNLSNGVYTNLATGSSFSASTSSQLPSAHSLDSPLRSTRLASAPNMGGNLPPLLSKLTRPPLAFGDFSFLGSRGRSGSTTDLEVPTRPARPPSLSLRDDPEPRLVHSNSGSSVGSAGLELRRKRSSPAVHGHERRGSNSGSLASTRRKGSDAGIVSIPTIHRESSNGSHRTAGTQQPTPTSPSPLLLKQRRETVFPTTPRSHDDSPMGRSDLPGFIVDVGALLPLKSPAPSTRKAHLPIGPKSVPVVPTRSEPTPVSVPVLAPSTSANTIKSRPKPAPVRQPPPSPTFEPVPVRWRGLTMDAAKWTFSSNQLHSIVSRAIKQSAETSSVRLLPLDVLDQELPVEVERLEQLRDVLQTKYKAQVRRRRLLMRSLALYIDGHDPPTSKRLLDELEDVGVVCDQLAEDLYLVGDQLGQIARLRDVHHTSALAVALRKINQSYIRARSEVVELQAERTSLEAERDEAWLMAESLERELVESKPDKDESRVSAARRSSIRQSKLSLKRTARSSTSSMRYHSILFPRPPTSAPLVDPPEDPVPPVPPMNKHHLEPSRPESIGVLPSGIYALSPGEKSQIVATPSASSHDLYMAQNELLKMLGLSYKEYGFKIRPRSYSECESVPGSPEARLSAAPSAFRPGSRGKLFRSSSDQALRRHSSGMERVIAVEVPEVGGILEDPAAILAALTLPQD